MLLLPTLLSLPVADSSLLCWLLLISFCVCMLACMCAHFLLYSWALQSHWCLHQSKYSAHNQHTKAIRETGKTVWLWLRNAISSVVQISISHSQSLAPASGESRAVVLQNESVPSPTTRNPSLASSRQMEVTAKGQIFLCYQHALIDLCPPKAQDSSSSSALRPQAVLGPGANKTLKACNWDLSAQYSLSLYSPRRFLTLTDNSAQEPLYHGCESQNELRREDVRW